MLGTPLFLSQIGRQSHRKLLRLPKPGPLLLEKFKAPLETNQSRWLEGVGRVNWPMESSDPALFTTALPVHGAPRCQLREARAIGQGRHRRSSDGSPGNLSGLYPTVDPHQRTLALTIPQDVGHAQTYATQRGTDSTEPAGRS
jgi:hypothetical protein